MHNLMDPEGVTVEPQSKLDLTGSEEEILGDSSSCFCVKMNTTSMDMYSS
jgi:hypothetical protein